jgi:imidazolonepropionase-like amidohydrolase
MDAIVAATLNNAKALGWDEHVGTLAPGRWADFLVVDGDPLKDIRVLGDRQRITAVYNGGAAVPRAASAPTRRRMSHERSFAVSSTMLER